jgi:hypothetical protein
MKRHIHNFSQLFASILVVLGTYFYLFYNNKLEKNFKEKSETKIVKLSKLDIIRSESTNSYLAKKIIKLKKIQKEISKGAPQVTISFQDESLVGDKTIRGDKVVQISEWLKKENKGKIDSLKQKPIWRDYEKIITGYKIENSKTDFTALPILNKSDSNYLKVFRKRDTLNQQFNEIISNDSLQKSFKEKPVLEKPTIKVVPATTINYNYYYTLKKQAKSLANEVKRAKKKKTIISAISKPIVYTKAVLLLTDSMMLNNSRVVKLILSTHKDSTTLTLEVRESLKSLKEMSNYSYKTMGKTLEYANQMRAHLVGTNFDVELLDLNETQKVLPEKVVTWSWNVTPKKEGTQYLYLSLEAIAKSADQEGAFKLTDWTKNISVNVEPETLLDRLNRFVTYISPLEKLIGFLISTGGVYGLIQFVKNLFSKPEQKKKPESE